MICSPAQAQYFGSKGQVQWSPWSSWKAGAKTEKQQWWNQLKLLSKHHWCFCQKLLSSKEEAKKKANRVNKAGQQAQGPPVIFVLEKSQHTPISTITTSLILGLHTFCWHLWKAWSLGSETYFLHVGWKLMYKAALAVLSILFSCVLYRCVSSVTPSILQLHNVYLRHWQVWGPSSLALA